MTTDEYKLPSGKVCRDCKRFDGCKATIGRDRKSEACAWSPIMFEQRVVCIGCGAFVADGEPTPCGH